MTYVRRMMAEKDRRGQIGYARAEGEAIGRAEGRTQEKAEVANALKAKGIAVDIISECTGLTQDQIEAL